MDQDKAKLIMRISAIAEQMHKLGSPYGRVIPKEKLTQERAGADQNNFPRQANLEHGLDLNRIYGF